MLFEEAKISLFTSVVYSHLMKMPKESPNPHYYAIEKILDLNSESC